MDDNIVAALAVFCIFGLPIAGLIISRAFRFIERLEMIKRGIVPPPNGGSRAWREWARQQQQQQQGAAPGTPWQQQGPIPAGWQQQQYYTPPQQAAGCDDDAQRALFKGIRLALIGFAILIGLSFIGGTPGTSDFHGGPWLLGGLIPMFVGIAQVIIAVLSGAQLPGVTTQRFTPPPPPPPSGPGPTITPPSGAWQQPPPRSRFEELSKPVQPPDVR
jgi:hypothetical protein